MSESITSLGAAADSTYGNGQHPSAAPSLADQPESEPDPSQIPDTADQRLFIEDDGEDGALVYKILDGRTGAVVQMLLREQVLKLREARNYVAGQVIKTRV